jgi:hypothetical protein
MSMLLCAYDMYYTRKGKKYSKHNNCKPAAAVLNALLNRVEK